MARPTLDRNKKFKRLVLDLGIPRPHVRGYLEMLWDTAHECGDPFFSDLEDIEAAAEWEKEPGVLAAALLARKFIDQTEDGYELHDYWDHCPEYVKKRRVREIQRQDRGRELKDNGRQRQTTADNGHTRAPAPAPAPNTPSECDGGNPPKPTQKFIPPTVAEIDEYRCEKGLRLDPDQFHDFYASKNWMVGKNKMKDWRAAIRNWARREAERAPKRNGGYTGMTSEF